MKTSISAGLGAATLTLLLAGCAASAPAPDPTDDAAPNPAVDPLADAKEHCADTGGAVQSRQPTWGTNGDPAAWVKIGDPIDVCAYQTLDEDDSRIYVDLVTISSGNPTLAGIAYLTQPAMPDEDDGGSPANQYCREIGSAVDYGVGAAGGGLVDADDPNDAVIPVCFFADGSFIDDWGLTYHAGGIVRGKDLTEVFRFDQESLPDIAFR